MTPVYPFPAIVAIKIRKIIGRFKQQGAVTPDTALPLEKIGVSKRLILRKLIRHNVIMEVAPDKYYLNEENLAVYNRNRRTRAAIVVVCIIIALVLYFLLHPNP
jgi:hypothetical protein